MPYDEARHSEFPPYPVQQVSRAAFNRQKCAAITTCCISRAVRSLRPPVGFTTRRCQVSGIIGVFMILFAL